MNGGVVAGDRFKKKKTQKAEANRGLLFGQHIPVAIRKGKAARACVLEIPDPPSSMFCWLPRAWREGKKDSQPLNYQLTRGWNSEWGRYGGHACSRTVYFFYTYFRSVSVKGKEPHSLPGLSFPHRHMYTYIHVHTHVNTYT